MFRCPGAYAEVAGEVDRFDFRAVAFDGIQVIGFRSHIVERQAYFIAPPVNELVYGTGFEAIVAIVFLGEKYAGAVYCDGTVHERLFHGQRARRRYFPGIYFELKQEPAAVTLIAQAGMDSDDRLGLRERFASIE